MFVQALCEAVVMHDEEGTIALIVENLAVQAIAFLDPDHEEEELHMQMPAYAPHQCSSRTLVVLFALAFISLLLL